MRQVCLANGIHIRPTEKAEEQQTKNDRRPRYGEKCRNKRNRLHCKSDSVFLKKRQEIDKTWDRKKLKTLKRL